MSRETLPSNTCLRLGPSGLRFASAFTWGFVDIDPPMAVALLERAPSPTPETPFSRAYARCMASHAWHVTGESIALDSEGVLVDGVARLLACVASGRPFRTLVVTGLTPGLRPFLDLRAPSRRPVLPGAEYGGAALDLIGAALPAVPFSLGHASPTARVGTVDALIPSLAAAEGIDVRGGLSRSVLQAIHYLASGEDTARADAFLDAMALPDLEPGSPPRMMAASLDVMEGFDERSALCLMAVAWRAYLRRGPFGLPAPPGLGVDILSEMALGRLAALPSPTAVVPGPDPEVRFENVDARTAASLLAPLGADRGGGDACPAFSEDLLACRWHRTGHTIKIGHDGLLADGTRRLRAVVASARAIKGLVVRGVGAEAMRHVDHGPRGRLSMRHREADANERDEALADMRKLQQVRATQPETLPEPVTRARRERQKAVVDTVTAVRKAAPRRREWKKDVPSLFDVPAGAPVLGRRTR